MALRVEFNTPIDGASGRVDMMRVLASSGRITNDFDPAVVFSSNFLSAQIESFSAVVSTITAGTNTSASGSFTLGRKYKTFPTVFACYHQTNGIVHQPLFFNQYFAANDPSGNGTVNITLERQDAFMVDIIDLGSNNYRLDWIIYNYGPGSQFTNGTVRLRTVGQGI